MTSDRDFIVVRGKRIRHTTAARDWVCGVCGGRLVTRWFHEEPHWRTVCWAMPTKHSSDEFILKSTWAYREHRRMAEAAQAKDVFDHLPAEVRAQITEGRETCQSKD